MKDVRKAVLLSLFLCAVYATTLFAQQAPATPTATKTEAAASTPADKVVLAEGTEVNLKFDQDLSSKTAVQGDTVEFVLAEDLKVGNAIVAKAGSKAVGEVTNAKKAGMMGKAGELNLRVEYVRAGDTKIRLRGTKGREGDDKTGTAVALTVLFGPIGLIKHGKNIEIAKGSPLKVYVAEDINLVPLS